MPTPELKLPEMTLRAPGKVPPTSAPAPPELWMVTPTPFPSARVPVASVPIRFPWMVLRVEWLMLTPPSLGSALTLLEMRLPAPGAVPPTTLSEPPSM